MIKKSVTYTDFNGNERTEDFYFNLTEAELVELEVGVEGGMKAMLKQIIKENDQKRIYEYFKKIVLMSYGEKSLDGRGFKKSEELRDSFAPTEAFSNIVMELSKNATEAANFVNGIIPKKLSEAVAAQKAEQAVQANN
jgi:hypothetical protein